MRVLLFLIVLLMLGTAALPGNEAFAQLRKNKKNKKKKPKSELKLPDNGEDVSTNMAIEELYIEATTAKILEDYQEAIDKFKEVLRLDPDNHAAMYELAGIYFSSNQWDLAKGLVEEAVELDPENIWYLYLNAEIVAYRNEFEDAAAIYDKLLTKDPENIDFYFDKAFMLIKAEEYEDAIKVLNQVEEKIGPDESVITQKQKLWIRLDKIDKAAEEVQKLIDINPREPHYYQLLADMYYNNNQREEALEVYEKMLELDPENAAALLTIAELAKEEGDREKYMKYTRQAFSVDKVDVETKLRILVPYVQKVDAGDEEAREEAFTLAQLLIETHPDDARAHAVYGDLLYYDEQKAEALQQYEQSLDIDGSEYQVWQQAFFLLSELEEYQKLADRSESALELFPNQPLVYYFNGVANSQLENHQAAVDVLDVGKDMVIGNPGLKAQFFSLLGDSYNSLKQYKESDKAFDKSLYYDAENPYTLNNYSYYLSLRGERLDDAEKMSAKANRLESNNASFQDTYAWILFKQGDYQEAKTWIEKALENGGENSAEVVEHYGDILYKLGDVEKALIYWKKAESLGSDSELIGKKIADRKFYE